MAETIRSFGEDNIRTLNGIAADIVYDLAVQYPPAMVKFILSKAAMMVAGGDGAEFIKMVHDKHNNRCGGTDVYEKHSRCGGTDAR